MKTPGNVWPKPWRDLWTWLVWSLKTLFWAADMKTTSEDEVFWEEDE